MLGYVSKIESLGTVDGPGVRCVIFTSGCPLRCTYCHNPETWRIDGGEAVDSQEIAEKISRLYPYIKNGGVTFSGGEPCVQAEFVCDVISQIMQTKLHIALDTSGSVLNKSVEKLISMCDLIMLDIKFTSDEEYGKYTGGSLSGTLEFLDKCRELNKEVWVRHVVVPGLNDSEEDIIKLKKIIEPYGNISRVELLPFKKLCIEKYEDMKIPFPLSSVPECDKETINRLYKALETNE